MELKSEGDKFEQEYLSLLFSHQWIGTGKGPTNSLICLIKVIKKNQMDHWAGIWPETPPKW